MLPLIPLALGLVPQLASWLFGSKAADVAARVSSAVTSVTGATSPEDVAAIIAGKPEVAASLRIELARIAAEQESAQRQAEQAELASFIQDTAAARQQTVDLAKSGSAIAWGAPVLSGIILVAFATMLYTVLTHAVPADMQQLATIMLTTLAAMATQVSSYWLGSSRGSQGKDATIAAAAAALAVSTPPAPVAPAAIALTADELNARSLAAARARR